MTLSSVCSSVHPSVKTLLIEHRWGIKLKQIYNVELYGLFENFLRRYGNSNADEAGPAHGQRLQLPPRPARPPPAPAHSTNDTVRFPPPPIAAKPARPLV
ncbi:hypothetical protein EVAR_65954_1 [Eumeta japonica]|uniref:Uncharacterized protein n=1 Tax=Eumeta variegata TaxID=151549 RepID=A0A4C1ZQ15_EUMVA|nr:hypothetical protein EVAR_65954_1 [Eumeta japonica]